MRKAFSLIFVSLLLVPAATWLIGLDLGTSVDHMGLAPPRLFGRALLEREYYLSFDQYFKDSFSLRGPLILAKNWLDYRVFHMTDASSVHVGREGWLYGRKSIEDYRKEACKDKAYIGHLVLQLHALEKMIQASGRRFFFIVAPNKSTLYPEFVGFVPRSVLCNRSLYDLLLENTGAHPLRSFIRLDELLRAAKANDLPLYDKTSSYWTSLGAEVAAGAIGRQIFDGHLEEDHLNHISIGGDSPGDLYRLLMGLSALTEEEPVRHFVRSNLWNLSDLPSGIVYGDDFTQNLLPSMVHMFGQLDVIRGDCVPTRRHGENLLAYDLILMERAESELGTIRIELDKIFSVLETEAHIPERYPLDLHAASPVSHVSLDVRADGLEIKSVGGQSVLELMSLPASNDGMFRVLKLAIEAAQSDLMTIKYMTETPFVAQKSLKRQLTELYLPLPFQKSLSIRILPGNRAGFFLLRSAEILGFPSSPTRGNPLQEETAPTVADRERKLVFSAEDSGADIALSKDEPGISGAAEDKVVRERGSEEVEVETAKEEIPDETSIVEGYTLVREETETAISKPENDDSNRASLAKAATRDTNPPVTASGVTETSISNEGSNTLEGQDRGRAPVQEDSREAVFISKSDTDISVDRVKSVVRDSSSKDVMSGDRDRVPVNKSSIFVTEFEKGRVFQREGTGTDIVISGYYDGLPGAIEARVVRDSTLEEIVPWTVIDEHPRNGIFLGVIPAVPQGGWYNVQVRSSKDHTVSYKGSHEWGVGMLVACMGQSNMKEWFHTGTALRAHSLLRKYTGKGWEKLETRGNAAVAFGNRLIERLGIPVGLLDYSVNGSGLRKEANWGTGYWENTAPGSIYNRFLAGVYAAGGSVEFVIWIQGEADAARGTVTESEYRTSLESFITNQVRADVHNGSARKYLPFLIAMMIKRPGGKDQPHQAIRNAQKHVAENIPDSYLAASTLDLKNHGKQHLDPDAYIILGRRVAQTVLYILGKEKYYRGPRVDAVEQKDDVTIDVRLEHRGGTDFSPTSGITGWEALENGISVPIGDVNRHDPKTIRIALKHPTNGKVKVRYLYGAMPDTTNPVRDNSPMALPLEEFEPD